jgi:hypothetical protein
LEQTVVTKEILLKVMKWQYNSGDTGLSSECMAATLCGIRAGKKMTPADPSDFNRCLKLLIAVPELRERIWKMKGVSKQWETLVNNWHHVESCFIDEVGIDWCKAKSAPKTYAMMKDLGL